MTKSQSGHVSVLIVNWNTRELLAKCLESLERLPEAGDLEIVVVDNGSIDDSVTMLKERFGNVKLLENEINEGFARAVNQAFSESSQPYALLLNSDTEVRPRAIARCRDHLTAHPDVGAVGCQILNPDGSAQNSIFRFPSLRGLLSTTSWLAQAFPTSPHFNHDRYGRLQPTDVTSVDVVMGSFLMVRRSDHAVSLLDDGYYMYGEEADLCRSLKARGKTVQFVPQARVEHVRGASSRTPQQRAWSDEAKKRSLLRFLKKWHGWPTAYLANIVMAVGMTPRIAGWWVTDVMDRRRGVDAGRLHKAAAFRFHLRSLIQPSLMVERYHGPPVEKPDETQNNVIHS